MGNAAEYIADCYDISRETMDEYAFAAIRKRSRRSTVAGSTLKSSR